MNQRRAQIGRLQRGHIGQYGIQLVQGNLDGVDRRWAIVGERLGQFGDLGKGRMRVQDVKHLKPLVPIRQRAQHEKRRCRPDADQPLIRRADVTPPAMHGRQGLAQGRVSFKDNGLFLGLLQRRQRENRRPAVRRVHGHSAQPHVRVDPIHKFPRPRMLWRQNLQPPCRPDPGKQRLTLLAKGRLGLRPGRDHLDPHLRLQRESRQHVGQQTALHQRIRHGQTDNPVIRVPRSAQPNSQNTKQDTYDRSHSKG